MKKQLHQVTEASQAAEALPQNFKSQDSRWGFPLLAMAVSGRQEVELPSLYMRVKPKARGRGGGGGRRRKVSSWGKHQLKRPQGKTPPVIPSHLCPEDPAYASSHYAPNLLCDFRQVTSPLRASVPSKQGGWTLKKFGCPFSPILPITKPD